MCEPHATVVTLLSQNCFFPLLVGVHFGREMCFHDSHSDPLPSGSISGSVYHARASAVELAAFLLQVNPGPIILDFRIWGGRFGHLIFVCQGANFVQGVGTGSQNQVFPRRLVFELGVLDPVDMGRTAGKLEDFERTIDELRNSSHITAQQQKSQSSSYVARGVKGTIPRVRVQKNGFSFSNCLTKAIALSLFLQIKSGDFLPLEITNVVEQLPSNQLLADVQRLTGAIRLVTECLGCTVLQLMNMVMKQVALLLMAACCACLGESVLRDPRLLRHYSALRDLQQLGDAGAGQAATHMRVPLLALLGVQSSGKTSFLESIVGWAVGFTARGTATRCPVRYILRDGPNRRYSVAGRSVSTRGELRDAVAAHMTALGKTFTSEALIVTIEEPGQITLDVTDLPGLKDSGDPDFNQLRNITQKFLQDARTIPVVMCQASKSHETQHDLDILRELGLTFSNSLVIMNYFNKQLPDMTRVSQVNSYVLGQRGKFPNARFVMLHHKDGVDKERMSADELEDYIQQLPKKEQREFETHIERMEKDEELTKEAIESFGVSRAINHVQGILLDWMRDNCRDVISSLRGDVMRYEHNVNELQQMIAASNPREIKDGWRNYTLAYENIISMMQYGRIASMKLPQPLFQLGPRDKWAETRTVVSTYPEEIAKISVPKPPGWLETEALDGQLKGSYTGHQLHMRLGPHAAFSRLVRVLGYMLFSMQLEPLTEEEMMTKSGHSRDGATHSFNKHTVILQLVTHGLLQMQDVVAVTLQQVRAIYVAVLEKAHKSLEQFFPHIAHHRQFQKMLDDKYEELLMQKLTAGANAIHDRIVTKTRYFAVDLPNRILVLFGLTPMVQDVLVTNPASAYYNENKSDAERKSRRMPSRELDGVSKQRDALLAMKARLYEHQQRNPFSLIDFVEGGQQDLHQDEYRTINVDDINSIAHQYYMLVKGLLVLDIEGILDHDIFHPLENKEVLLRSMREEMLQAVSDLEDDEVNEMVGAGFQEMLQEQQDTNATLVKLKTVLAELEMVASTELASDALPSLEWFLLLSEAVSADVLAKAARAAKTDLVNLLRLPAHTVSTGSEPDVDHSFIRVTVRPASTRQGHESLRALIAEAEGKVSLGRVAEVSRDGEAILSTSKSRCLALNSNVSQPAKVANATHQAEGPQEDEAEAEAETDANIEDEGDM
ncbi:unnamed protein product [Symbiodinium sp. CCMP2592]|nr:unnamed protein product [Symbiodinium sp. CCMP2592]